MSVIKNNSLLKGASGMLGKQIVFREIRGRIIMCNRPRTFGILTAHQKKTKERFLHGVQYARKQMENAETKSEYAKGINNNKHSAYLVALTDYLKAPVVHSIDTSLYQGDVGNIITVHASDDFKVVSVQVTISDYDGVVIEQGDAQLQLDSLDGWIYTTTVANTTLSGSKIEGKASDMPGNVTTFESTL